MRLKDKVALITGGAGDIGLSIAEEFLNNGARVVLFDIDAELLRQVSEKLGADDRLCAAGGDARSLADLHKAVDLAEQRYGKLDVLVTSAGVLKHQPIDQLTEEDWDRVVGINLTGTFLACKAAVPAMKANGGGRIVTISSVGGRTGRPKVGADYAASKAGVAGITMCLARELGSFGITVNSIAPGPLAGRMTAQMPPENLKVLISTACVARLGRAQDIAHAAVFLASDEAEWVTGEVLDVNGGVYI
jgi:NAD(P)-dependent dehydrogenase (short-subunit alcohol dehydrogenase family)